MGRVRERVRERVMAALKEKSMSKRKQLAWLATLSEASAGALGQLFSTMLLYPLDTSKTRVQARMDSGTTARGKRRGSAKGGEIEELFENEEGRSNGGETGTRREQDPKEWF